MPLTVEQMLYAWYNYLIYQKMAFLTLPKIMCPSFENMTEFLDVMLGKLFANTCSIKSDVIDEWTIK